MPTSSPVALLNFLSIPAVAANEIRAVIALVTTNDVSLVVEMKAVMDTVPAAVAAACRAIVLA